MSGEDHIAVALSAISAQIAKLEGVRAALQQVATQTPLGATSPHHGLPNGGKAPPGSLSEAILGVLTAKPVSNGQIRGLLAKGGYTYSTTTLHVSKTLTRLLRARKVRRVGRGTASRYVRGKP